MKYLSIRNGSNYIQFAPRAVKYDEEGRVYVVPPVAVEFIDINADGVSFFDTKNWKKTQTKNEKHLIKLIESHSLFKKEIFPVEE